MSYSLCRFWAYDESKKIVGASKFPSFHHSKYPFDICLGQMPNRPHGNWHWREAWVSSLRCHRVRSILRNDVAGGIAGLVGNPGGKLFNLRPWLL